MLEIAEKHEFFFGSAFSRIVGSFAAFAFDLLPRWYTTRLIANLLEYPFPSNTWTRRIENKTGMHRQLTVRLEFKCAYHQTTFNLQTHPVSKLSSTAISKLAKVLPETLLSWP